MVVGRGRDLIGKEDHLQPLHLDPWLFFRLRLPLRDLYRMPESRGGGGREYEWLSRGTLRASVVKKE